MHVFKHNQKTQLNKQIKLQTSEFNSDFLSSNRIFLSSETKLQFLSSLMCDYQRDQMSKLKISFFVLTKEVLDNMSRSTFIRRLLFLLFFIYFI